MDVFPTVDGLDVIFAFDTIALCSALVIDTTVDMDTINNVAAEPGMEMDWNET